MPAGATRRSTWPGDTTTRSGRKKAKTGGERHASHALSCLRAEGRDDGDRSAACDQDAARNRDSETQRPISAEAIRKAIEITRPGRYEYELEAEATYHLIKNGVQGNGYPAIVGTGPNVNVWHYQNSAAGCRRAIWW
jgi:hypothetical protein